MPISFCQKFSTDIASLHEQLLKCREANCIPVIRSHTGHTPSSLARCNSCEVFIIIQLKLFGTVRVLRASQLVCVRHISILA